MGPMRSYHVKENPIGSAVIEILLYKQTHKHPVTFIYILLLGIKGEAVSGDWKTCASPSPESIDPCICRKHFLYEERESLVYVINLPNLAPKSPPPFLDI